MVDVEMLIGMGFSFLMTLTMLVFIGGIVLLRPLMKHLGNYLEARAEERQALGDRSPADWDRLFANLDSLGERLNALEERQDFTEKLLARPEQGSEEG
ncbi:MAG: hypothetical protein HKO65_15155 [Gemmatimonadetes bacterium]|nr:hypothetical protein [Gemmatimonadota bacterium]NNM06429.1 hypothetical protein [Gemmatimonadota bacterium]